MNHYNGIDGDSIQRGGAYNKKSVGHEVCNFSDIDGVVYGYVQPTGHDNVRYLEMPVEILAVSDPQDEDA